MSVEKYGLPVPAAKDHHAALLQMADRAPPDERLGHLVHLDGRHHPRVHALLFQRVLQRQRVDHRRQHAHVIGRHPVHLFGLLGDAAEEIPAAHHEPNLDSERVHVGHFGRNFVHAVRFHSKALARCQCLAGELQKNALEDGLRHGRCDRFAVGFQGEFRSVQGRGDQLPR